MIVAVSDRLSRDGFEDEDDHQRGLVGTLTSPTARFSVRSARRGMVGVGAFGISSGQTLNSGGCCVEIEAVEDGVTWRTVSTRVTCP